jgi:hypothetical protein
MGSAMQWDRNETGQDRLNQIINSMDNPILDQYEKRFIHEVRGKPYGSLSSHQKVVVNRIYGWLHGE